MKPAPRNYLIAPSPPPSLVFDAGHLLQDRDVMPGIPQVDDDSGSAALVGE